MSILGVSWLALINLLFSKHSAALPRADSWKRLVPFVGLALQVVSVAFIVHVVVENLSRIRMFDIDASDLAIAITAILAICLFSLGLQIWAWFILIRGASPSAVRATSMIWLFGRTAIAKYMPGNVFHYIGRQALAEKLACGQGPVLASSMAEVAVVVAAACSIAVVPVFTLRLPSTGWLPLPSTGWLPPALVIAFLCGGVLLPLAILASARMIASFRWFAWSRPLAQLSVAAWLIAYVLYVLFILAGASAFAGVIVAVSGNLELKTLLIVFSAYGSSYVLGYLTPGAPGGIGIREALLVLWLAPLVGETVVVFVAILHRLCSIAAEVTLFISTFFFAPEQHQGA